MWQTGPEVIEVGELSITEVWRAGRLFASSQFEEASAEGGPSFFGAETLRRR